jgi:hypothetical protein
MKTQRIPFLILNLICSIGLFTGLSAKADSCKIAGISNPPQTISCKMRGIYFEKIEGRIECVNGQYFFSRYAMDGRQLDTNHIINAYHRDRSRGGASLVFPIDEFGTPFIVIPRSGNRFKGYFEYGSQGTYSLRDFYSCKAI